MGIMTLEIVFQGEIKDIPEEFSKMIVEKYNRIVQHRIDNPDKWYPIDTHPEKYHLITEPFELNGRRPYISDESEVTDVDLNKEVVHEFFSMDDDKLFELEYVSNINPAYWELYSDIYDLTGDVTIWKRNVN